MSLTDTAILSAIELALYTCFVPLLGYTALKHRQPGLLGHLYLLLFLTLRLTADGLELSNRNKPAGTDTAGAVVGSIGLSPLLLTSVAVLNEARTYMKQNEYKDRTIKNLLVDGLMHLLVVAGAALLAVGGARAATTTHESIADHDRKLAKVGAVLLVVAWVTVCFWSILTLKKLNQTRPGRPVSILVCSVVLAQPFLGARVVYTSVSTFGDSQRLNLITAPFAIKLVLVFLMQFLVAATIQTGLLFSRSMTKNFHLASGAHRAGKPK